LLRPDDACLSVIHGIEQAGYRARSISSVAHALTCNSVVPAQRPLMIAKLKELEALTPP
jgi:hypothetical protein